MAQIVKFCNSCQSGAVFTQRVRNGREHTDPKCDFCMKVHRKIKTLDEKIDPGEEKVCKGCEDKKDIGEFNKDSKEKDGHSKYCRGCKKIIKFERLLRGTYGLSLTDYNRMVISQKRKCAICLQEKPLVVDHCHKTGKVRGLLCSNCNSLIGFALDKPEVLMRAAEYVRR